MFQRHDADQYNILIGNYTEGFSSKVTERLDIDEELVYEKYKDKAGYKDILKEVKRRRKAWK